MASVDEQDRVPVRVYASERRADTYLYLPASCPPEDASADLLQVFGKPRFVMELELHSGRSLARADVTEVMGKLRADGYYLQLPPTI